MPRVGIVEYINALPFSLPYKLGELQTKHSYTYAVPSVLNQKLRDGELDLALTSCTESFNDSYRLIPGYCLATRHEILSVNLYMQAPLADGVRISLPHQSAAAAILLKVLCRHFWKIEPNFQKCETHDGFLLIGDDALKNLTFPGYQTIDLAAAWYKETGLPFVFAVLMGSKDAENPADEFEKALAWSEANRERLVEAAHAQCGLSKELINRYYDLCAYRLGKKELEGLQEFQKLSANVSEICA